MGRQTVLLSVTLCVWYGAMCNINSHFENTGFILHAAILTGVSSVLAFLPTRKLLQTNTTTTTTTTNYSTTTTYTTY
jgi:hypothetical protein